MNDYKFIAQAVGVVLEIRRTCGHIDEFFYANEKCAQKDIPRLLTTICVSCHNRNRIDELNSK